MGSRGASSGRASGGGAGRGGKNNSAAQGTPKIFLKPRPGGVAGVIWSRQSDEQKFGGAYLSAQRKDGSWGKPVAYKAYGSEKNAEEVLKRISKNNPGSKFRLVYENE